MQALDSLPAPAAASAQFRPPAGPGGEVPGAARVGARLPASCVGHACSCGAGSEEALRERGERVQALDVSGGCTHRRNSDPDSSLVVADGGPRERREDRLPAWAGEMHAQLAAQRNELRRARLELMGSQEVRPDAGGRCTRGAWAGGRRGPRPAPGGRGQSRSPGHVLAPQGSGLPACRRRLCRPRALATCSAPRSRHGPRRRRCARRASARSLRAARRRRARPRSTPSTARASWSCAPSTRRASWSCARCGASAGLRGGRVPAAALRMKLASRELRQARLLCDCCLRAPCGAAHACVRGCIEGDAASAWSWACKLACRCTDPCWCALLRAAGGGGERGAARRGGGRAGRGARREPGAAGAGGRAAGVRGTCRAPGVQRCWAGGAAPGRHGARRPAAQLSQRSPPPASHTHASQLPPASLCAPPPCL